MKLIPIIALGLLALIFVICLIWEAIERIVMAVKRYRNKKQK